MRIIAGKAKGRRLRAPPGLATRPFTDRAKEGLFSSLGDAVVGSDVIDLYAGSGSLGLEALSRGARSAVFVESGAGATGVLADNLSAIGLGGEVVAGDVEEFLVATEDRFDLAFVDPPYELALPSVLAVLDLVASRLRAEGIAILHRRAGGEIPAVSGLTLVDRRQYGDTELWRYLKEEA